MQSMEELLGVVKRYLDEGSKMHVDFYNDELFSISIYGVNDIRIDKVRKDFTVNEDFIFSFADCKNPRIEDCDDGILVSANIENATLDIVIYNRLLD